MAEQHACTLCKKKRAGRFTRRKDTVDSGWSQGFQLPFYYCWQCLPNGEGRGEHEEQPVPTKKPTSGELNKAVVNSLYTPSRQEGQAVVVSLQTHMRSLPILTTDADYLTYDEAFGKVKKARKEWKLRMYGTSAKPGPIPNIRAGLEQLYSLNREIDQPLEALETTIENKMKGFKLAEQRRLRVAEEERLRAEDEARQQEENLRQRLEAAKSKPARAKLEERLAAAQEVIADIEQAPAAEALKADNSSSRSVQVPVVTDLMTLLAAIVEGAVHLDSASGQLVTLNQPELNRRFKLNPSGVGFYPGVEIQDDMQIRGR